MQRVDKLIEWFHSDDDRRSVFIRTELRKPKFLLITYALFVILSVAHYLFGSSVYPTELQSIHNYVRWAALFGVLLQSAKLAFLIFQRKRNAHIDDFQSKINTTHTQHRMMAHDRKEFDVMPSVDVLYDKQEKRYMQKYYSALRFLVVVVFITDTVYLIYCVCLSRTLSNLSNHYEDGVGALNAHRWLVRVNFVGSILVYASTLSCYSIVQLNTSLRSLFSGHGRDERSVIDEYIYSLEMHESTI